MSQTSRQFKLKAKLQLKTIYKSSLPDIDPLNPNLSKYGQKFITKPTLKSVKGNDRNDLSLTKKALGSKQVQSILNINPNGQSEQSGNLNKISSKKSSIEVQKQLMTADTVRPQPNPDNTINLTKQTISEGLDMWNLNKNLKQFSQTRKLSFYKTKNHNSNPPHFQTTLQVMNKTKTQQIRSMYKIYGGDPNRLNNTERQRSQGHLNYKKLNDPIKKVKLTQKDAKSYSTISNAKMISPLGNTLYGTLPVRKHQSNFDTTHYGKPTNHFSFKNQLVQTPSPHLNPYLRTFINGSHLKRQPSNRNIHILEMNTISTNTNIDKNIFNNKQEKKQHNLRRNRFQKIQLQQQFSASDSNVFDDSYSKSLDCESKLQPPKNQQEIDEEKAIDAEMNENLSSSMPGKIQFELSKQTEQRKKQYEYNRSIERINKFLLKRADDYVEQYHTFSSLPSSKIQFYIDSLNHSQFTGNTTQYKSSYRGQNFEQNACDFSFKETKQVSEKQKGKKGTSLSKNKKQLSKN